LPLLCVISLNGGWTPDAEHNKPARDLRNTRYEQDGEALGCSAAYVEEPGAIRRALPFRPAWAVVQQRVHCC